MENTSASSSCCSGTAKNTPWYLDRRFLLIAATVAIAGAGLWLGWPTLGILGLTPLIIALAPCLIMCGGLGAMMACSKSGKKNSAEQATTPASAEAVAETPALPKPNPGTVAAPRADGTGEIRLSA